MTLSATGTGRQVDMRPPAGPETLCMGVMRTRFFTGVCIRAPGFTWMRRLSGIPPPGGGPPGAANAAALTAALINSNAMVATTVFFMVIPHISNLYKHQTSVKLHIDLYAGYPKNMTFLWQK